MGKDEIIKIIIKNATLEQKKEGCLLLCIYSNGIENIADELVEKLTTPVVDTLICKGRCDHGYKDESGNELFLLD